MAQATRDYNQHLADYKSEGYDESPESTDGSGEASEADIQRQIEETKRANERYR